MKSACVSWRQLQDVLHEHQNIEVVQFSESVSNGSARSWESSRIVHAAAVNDAMKNATIFVNYVWNILPQTTVINEAIVEGLGLQSNTNLYATEPGLRFDSVPHSDQQDVFILQCQGRKHWKVWTPPKLLPTWHQR